MSKEEIRMRSDWDFVLVAIPVVVLHSIVTVLIGIYYGVWFEKTFYIVFVVSNFLASAQLVMFKVLFVPLDDSLFGERGVLLYFCLPITIGFIIFDLFGSNMTAIYSCVCFLMALAAMMAYSKFH